MSNKKADTPVLYDVIQCHDCGYVLIDFEDGREIHVASGFDIQVRCPYCKSIMRATKGDEVWRPEEE